MGRPYAPGQFGGQRGIIHALIHVRQIGAFGPDFFDPFQRLPDVRVGRMGFFPDAVHHPDLDPLQDGKGFFVQTVDVRRVGKIVEAVWLDYVVPCF